MRPQTSTAAGVAGPLEWGRDAYGRRAWSDAQLIKFAYAYEQATTHRRPPAFPATANLSVR